MIQTRESISRVRICEVRVYPVFNQSSGGSFPSYAISVALARWNFYCMPLRKIITPRTFCVFEAKQFGRLYWRTIVFLSSKRKPNISLYVEYSRTLIRCFEYFKFTHKFTKFHAKLLVHNFGQKTRTLISRNICYVKSGFQFFMK